MSSYQIGVFAQTKDGRVVLVTTRDGDYWIFPKGRREKGRRDWAVAEDEAYEEAGLRGDIKRNGKFFKVHSAKARKLLVFPMRVDDVLAEWPEYKQRERVIVSVERAEKLLQKDLREVLRSMIKRHRK